VGVGHAAWPILPGPCEYLTWIFRYEVEHSKFSIWIWAVIFEIWIWPIKFNQPECILSEILLLDFFLKGYSTFLELDSFYNSPRVKQLSFTVFESIQLIFWYLEEYQPDRFWSHWLSIVYSILWKSVRPETVRLLIFENSKPQLFNSGGVVKWAYFQKKWSIPLNLNLWALKKILIEMQVFKIEIKNCLCLFKF